MVNMDAITPTDLTRNGFVRVGPYYRAFGVLFTFAEAKRMLVTRQVPAESVKPKRGRKANPQKGTTHVLPM